MILEIKKKYVNSAVKNPADSFLKSGTSTTNDKQNHVHVYQIQIEKIYMTLKVTWYLYSHQCQIC